MIYAGLFLSAFTSATVLPGSSEAVLLTLLTMGHGEPAALLAVATAGNVLGSVSIWVLGRFCAGLSGEAWESTSTWKSRPLTGGPTADRRV